MELVLFANGLVLAGIVTLLVSLIRVRQLISVLPEGHMRRRWRLLLGMICLFVAGYGGQIVFFWDRYTDWSWMIVPVIFACGGCFVWMVCALSLQTTVDLKRVLRENDIDPLTQIYNRRFLDQRLAEELYRAERYELPLSLLMLDIDHFKSINDSYGHQAGDQVLIEFGKLVQNVIRGTDVVARYGGEEFLVLAPGTNAEAALKLAERIREKTAARKFILDGETEAQDIAVTVSAGVSEFSGAVDDEEKLMKVADQALYKAKGEGRNRVMLGQFAADCLIDSGELVSSVS